MCRRFTLFNPHAVSFPYTEPTIGNFRLSQGCAKYHKIKHFQTNLLDSILVFSFTSLFFYDVNVEYFTDLLMLNQKMITLREDVFID